MKIHLCKHYKNINKLQKKLSNTFSQESIVVKSCIDMCKVCTQSPVAKVGGEKFKAKSITKLLSKIEKR